MTSYVWSIHPTSCTFVVICGQSLFCQSGQQLHHLSIIGIIKSDIPQVLLSTEPYSDLFQSPRTRDPRTANPHWIFPRPVRWTSQSVDPWSMRHRLCPLPHSNNNVTRTFYYKFLHLARWRIVVSNKLWVIQYFPSLSGRTKPAWAALPTLSYNVFSNSYKNDITSHSSAPRVVSQT